jgi:hypothetical protein
MLHNSNVKYSVHSMANQIISACALVCFSYFYNIFPPVKSTATYTFFVATVDVIFHPSPSEMDICTISYHLHQLSVVNLFKSLSYLN